MTPAHDEIPGDWDTLSDRGDVAAGPPQPSAPEPGELAPPVVLLLATAWADLVAMLAVCTGALVAVMVTGQRPALPAFAWAAVLAVLWWAVASVLLVAVRQGTPGMLLAAVRFAAPVPPDRVPWVVAAALLGSLSLGATGLLGARRSPLQAAAGGPLVTDDAG
jgi:hypothetical protein